MTPELDGPTLCNHYRDARARIADLATSIDADPWNQPSACPGWSAHDVLAHVAALSTDILAGTLAGPPTDEQTAQQVADRRDASVTDLVNEWQANTAIDDLIEGAGPALTLLVMDALTHEADIRGALKADRLPPSAIEFHFDIAADGFGAAVTEAGLLALRVVGQTVTGGTRDIIAGAGDPVGTVSASAHDLGRAFLGRRSAEQVRAFEWTTDAEPYLPFITRFTLATHAVVD